MWLSIYTYYMYSSRIWSKVPKSKWVHDTNLENMTTLSLQSHFTMTWALADLQHGAFICPYFYSVWLLLWGYYLISDMIASEFWAPSVVLCVIHSSLLFLSVSLISYLQPHFFPLLSRKISPNRKQYFLCVPVFLFFFLFILTEGRAAELILIS